MGGREAGRCPKGCVAGEAGGWMDRWEGWEATLTLCRCIFLVSCSSSMFCSFLFISRRFSSPGFTRSLRTLPSPLRSVWPAATDTSARAQAESHPLGKARGETARDRAEKRATEWGRKVGGQAVSWKGQRLSHVNPGCHQL